MTQQSPAAAAAAAPAAAASPRRVLFVHAHPDDETTSTGATIARYAAEGVAVTVVTCTRGERGEDVLEGRDKALTGDEEAARFGLVRVAELTAAAAVLGVRDVRLLGGERIGAEHPEKGTWWDSGMADDQVPHPRAFSDGDRSTQTGELVAVIREVRPQVVVTYDVTGGYGHPDHIRAREIAEAAFFAAAQPGAYPDAGEPWAAAKFYETVIPRSALRRAAELMATTPVDGERPFEGLDAVPEDSVPFGIPDDEVTARIDARDFMGVKEAAMRRYRTQMPANGWFFALTADPERGFAVEHYRIQHGTPAPAADGVEDDLFAGVRAE